jgi:hypothetical protein
MAKVPVLRSNWKIDPAELAVAQERTEARLADLFVHRHLAAHTGPRPPIIVDGVELIGSPDEPPLAAAPILSHESQLPVEQSLPAEPQLLAPEPLPVEPQLLAPEPLPVEPQRLARAPLLQPAPFVIEPAHPIGRSTGRAGGAPVRPSTGLVGVFDPPVAELVGVFDPPPTQPVGVFGPPATEPAEPVGVFGPPASEPVPVMASSAPALAVPGPVAEPDDGAPEPLQLPLADAVDTSRHDEAEITTPVDSSMVSEALVDDAVAVEPALAEVEPAIAVESAAEVEPALATAEPPRTDADQTLAEVQPVEEVEQVSEVQPTAEVEPVPLAEPIPDAEPNAIQVVAAEPVADVISPSGALPQVESSADFAAGPELMPAVVTSRKPRPTTVAAASKGRSAAARSTAAAKTGAPAAQAGPSPASATTKKATVLAAKAEGTARPAARPAQAARSGGAAPAIAQVLPAALCPYCARLLQPPPSANRHCPRCRQLIVVKRVEGHLAYLTEAAVAIFEAERRKDAEAGRFGRERERWLKLAAAAGAPAGSTRRLAGARISEEVVEASRTLYMTTVERAFQSAKREHRWEDAARVKRDQAAALHRVAGAPRPPSDDVVGLHREGVAAELRGLAEIVRDAELVADDCCDTCRVDDRRIAVISKELAAPSLPHQGCPRGLCRCAWDLATRDREAVLRYLRRRPRPAAHVVGEKHPAKP